MLAHVLVLDGGIGMRSEVRDGVYTGRPAGPFTYREGKAQAIRELAGARGSTWPSRTRTRTPSPTCRCCGPWATRWRSTRTPRSRRSPAPRAGESCASTGSARSSRSARRRWRSRWWAEAAVTPPLERAGRCRLNRCPAPRPPRRIGGRAATRSRPPPRRRRRGGTGLGGAASRRPALPRRGAATGPPVGRVTHSRPARATRSAFWGWLGAHRIAGRAERPLSQRAQRWCPSRLAARRRRRWGEHSLAGRPIAPACTLARTPRELGRGVRCTPTAERDPRGHVLERSRPWRGRDR